MTDLQPGWAVVGNDGNRLGDIREVGQNYVLVATTMFSTNLHVPASAIANVDRDVIHLNVSAREAGSMGWEQPPRDQDAPVTDDADLHRHV
jgi:hypothetical protein